MVRAEQGQITILAPKILRNRMKLTRDNLYRIVLEEYLKDGGLQISESKVDDLIAHIKGGPRPDWMNDDERKIPTPPDVPKPEERNDSDTYPMDIPHDDAPESEYSGFQNDSGPDLKDQLAALIQGMPPEEVADLFQAVFEKIPGVEMSDAEEDAAAPTLYTRGADGQAQVKGFFPEFKINDLQDLIREVLQEGFFHDLSNEYGEGFVPLRREIAQKVWAAGGRANEAKMSATPEKANQMLWKLIEDEGIGDIEMMKEIHYDVIEELLDMQSENEDA